MGCNGKDKHFRTNRKFRLVRPDSDHSSNSNGNVAERSAVSNSSSESGISPSNCEMCAVDLAQNPNPNPNPNLNGNSTFEGNGLGFFTEEKLEEMLMQNLEFVCKDVISKLVSLGYDEDVALKAVLSNGFGWHGEMDVMANIFQNSLSYLDGGNSMRSENPEPSFSDLGQMLERTLAGMICFLQQNKPHLSKEDAMWCLLVTELHVGHASTLEMPVLSPPNGNGGGSNVEGIANGPIGFPSAMYRFRGGGSPDEISMNMSCSCSSDSCLEREFEYPKKFNLTPPVKSLLKRNVAVFSAGLRANTKHLQNQTQASLDSVKIGDSLGLAETGSEESPNFMNDGAINSVLSKFRDLHIQSAETGRIQIDQKDETILSLIHQIKDLERQVKERKEWAHQKAMQAARKLCNDLAELKMLRTERDETQLLKKGKQAIEDNTVKKLAEMENALRKASGQVDRANSAVKKLENENAEIRAEMEASKLSASESQKTYMEATKREKKFLKKLSALEKQRSKLQDDIAAEKHKISALQKQLAQAEAGQNEAEVFLYIVSRLIYDSKQYIFYVLLNCLEKKNTIFHGQGLQKHHAWMEDNRSISSP